MRTHASYRSTQPLVVLWIVMPLVQLLHLVELPRGGPAVAPLLISTASMVAVLLFLGRLVVEVDDRELRWRFGFVGWPRWRVPLQDIVALERVKSASAFSAGIRMGPGGERHYTARLGSPALRLKLRDGRTVMLGSPEPERLAAFIEARRPR